MSTRQVEGASSGAAVLVLLGESLADPRPLQRVGGPVVGADEAADLLVDGASTDHHRDPPLRTLLARPQNLHGGPHG